MVAGQSVPGVEPDLATALPTSPSLRFLPFSWTATQKWTLTALIAIAAFFRLWHMTAICLDGDEIISVLVGREGWASMTAAIAADSVHPPFFYYLLHLWLRAGNESLI